MATTTTFDRTLRLSKRLRQGRRRPLRQVGSLPADVASRRLGRRGRAFQGRRRGRIGGKVLPRRVAEAAAPHRPPDKRPVHTPNSLKKYSREFVLNTTRRIRPRIGQCCPTSAGPFAAKGSSEVKNSVHTDGYSSPGCEEEMSHKHVCHGKRSAQKVGIQHPLSTELKVATHGRSAPDWAETGQSLTNVGQHCPILADFGGRRIRRKVGHS